MGIFTKGGAQKLTKVLKIQYSKPNGMRFVMIWKALGERLYLIPVTLKLSPLMTFEIHWAQVKENVNVSAAYSWQALTEVVSSRLLPAGRLSCSSRLYRLISATISTSHLHVPQWGDFHGWWHSIFFQNPMQTLLFLQHRIGRYLEKQSASCSFGPAYRIGVAMYRALQTVGERSLAILHHTGTVRIMQPTK
jgi:hypothetical protein